MKFQPLTGNEAMAEAMRQVNPDVVAAYPITPATEVVQIFANFVSDGKVTTEFVATESEHSALSACIGAASGGARVITSTASQGLALMHEVLYIAAGLRLPIVICEVNRSLSSPINIHCDHSDTMGSRESGWIQIHTEDAQEAYDFTIQGVKIAEELFLPVIVSADGFITSHCMQRVEVLEDEEVKKFVGKNRTPYSVFEEKITIGSLALQDYFFEIKRQEIEAMEKAMAGIKKVMEEFNKKFNKHYTPVELYLMKDAEEVIVAIGSVCGTIKNAIKMMRKKGKRVGLIKLRIMRPLPKEELKKLLKKVKLVYVLDRSTTMSTIGGPIYVELRSLLYEQKEKPKMVNYIYGLGGREVSIRDIINIVEKPFTTQINYLGVRE